MNSNRPAPRAGGLPSNPRAGARPIRQVRRAPSTERTTRDDRGRSEMSSLPSRSIRPQQSLGTLPRPERSPLPSMPSRRRSLSRPRHAATDSQLSASSSTSTASSSASSFFDRIKAQAGYTSSRTSFEDDRDESSPINKEGVKSDLREDEGSHLTHTPNGDGSTIWSRVAAAAGSLTISVSKTWTTNIATFAGEETPPGQDSRLTRSMKAYHLAKARDPSDLPPWLFEPHERGRSDKRLDDDSKPAKVSYVDAPQSRGLRDIYEAAASRATSLMPRMNQPAIGGNRPSKATDRLQAMRDAKRGFTKTTNFDGSISSNGVRSANSSVDLTGSIPRDDGSGRLPPRVGLPSRPARRS